MTNYKLKYLKYKLKYKLKFEELNAKKQLYNNGMKPRMYIRGGSFRTSSSSSSSDAEGWVPFEDEDEGEFINDIGVGQSNIIKIKNITQNEYALMKMFNLTYSFDNNSTDYKNINEQFIPINLSKHIEGLIDIKYIKNSNCDLNNLRKELIRYNHNVLFAGNIHIEEGIIENITLDSDHYRSKNENYYNFIKFLHENQATFGEYFNMSVPCNLKYTQQNGGMMSSPPDNLIKNNIYDRYVGEHLPKNNIFCNKNNTATYIYDDDEDEDIENLCYRHDEFKLNGCNNITSEESLQTYYFNEQQKLMHEIVIKDGKMYWNKDGPDTEIIKGPMKWKKDELVNLREIEGELSLLVWDTDFKIYAGLYKERNINTDGYNCNLKDNNSNYINQPYRLHHTTYTANLINDIKELAYNEKACDHLFTGLWKHNNIFTIYNRIGAPSAWGQVYLCKEKNKECYFVSKTVIYNEYQSDIRDLDHFKVLLNHEINNINYTKNISDIYYMNTINVQWCNNIITPWKNFFIKKILKKLTEQISNKIVSGLNKISDQVNREQLIEKWYGDENDNVQDLILNINREDLNGNEKIELIQNKLNNLLKDWDIIQGESLTEDIENNFIIDYNDIKNVGYLIISELCPGDMSQIINNMIDYNNMYNLHSLDIIKFYWQALHSLYNLNKNNFIHGDLHNSNVMIYKRGTYLIGGIHDFDKSCLIGYDHPSIKKKFVDISQANSNNVSILSDINSMYTQKRNHRLKLMKSIIDLVIIIFYLQNYYPLVNHIDSKTALMWYRPEALSGKNSILTQIITILDQFMQEGTADVSIPKNLQDYVSDATSDDDKSERKFEIYIAIISITYNRYIKEYNDLKTDNDKTITINFDLELIFNKNGESLYKFLESNLSQEHFNFIKKLNDSLKQFSKINDDNDKEYSNIGWEPATI